MSRYDNAKKGIVWGIVNNVLNIVLPFITRTIIIHQLGNEYVGLGGLFSSLLNVLSLVELGIGSAITYVFYEPVAQSNYKRINSLLNLYRKIYRYIGVAVLVLALLMIPFLNHLISGEYPIGINIYYLYLIYVLNTVSSYFLFAYKKVLFTAYQRFDVLINITSIASIIQLLFQIVVLLIFNSYYMYAMIMPIATILNNIMCNIYLNLKYPECKCVGDVEKSDLDIIKKNVLGAFLSKLGETVYLSVDSIVISAFLGLVILGRYGNYFYIITALVAVFAVIHNSLRPIMGDCIVTESNKKNWEILKFVNFCYMFLVIDCCSCCLALFQPFEEWWQGKESLFAFPLVFMLVLYFYIGRINSIVTIYREAAGLWTCGRFIPLIAALFNLMLNIILVNFIGLYGVVLSSICSCIFVSIPGITKIVFKKLFKNELWKRQYYNEMIKMFVEMLFIICLNYCACEFIDFPISLFGLFLKAMFSFIISSALFVILNLKNYHMQMLFRYRFDVRAILNEI